MRLSDYSTSALTILAVVIIVLGMVLIFVIEWIGGLLVIGGVVIGFVVLVRFMRGEEPD